MFRVKLIVIHKNLKSETDAAMHEEQYYQEGLLS